MGFLLFLSLIYEGSFLKSDPQVPYKCFVAIGKFFIKDCIQTFILNVCSILDLFHDVFVILKYINMILKSLSPICFCIYQYTVGYFYLSLLMTRFTL